MRQIKDVFPYLLCILLSYFLLYLIRDTGSGIFVLLFILPIIILITSIIYSYKKGFSVIFPVLVGVFFLPFVYFVLNDSAIIYIFIFAFVSLLGSLIGYGFHKK